jgi:hypothetical protein
MAILYKIIYNVVRGGIMEDKNKYSLSFKNNEKEQELKNWILEKSEIIGFANYIKQVMYEKMLEDKAKK